MNENVIGWGNYEKNPFIRTEFPVMQKALRIQGFLTKKRDSFGTIPGCCRLPLKCRQHAR